MVVNGYADKYEDGPHPSQKTKELLVGSLLGAAVQDHITQLLLQRHTNIDQYN